MKRVLVVTGIAAALVAGIGPTASADHLCVTSGGQNLYCAPHISRQEICVTSGGREIVCV